jgi:phage terminase large subunit-like protein
VPEDWLITGAGLVAEQSDPGRDFRDSWRAMARPEQIPPDGRWRVWYLAGGRGGGKLLCVDTPIPTPQGWAPIGKLAAGDEVFDEAGKVCRVTGVVDDVPEKAYRLTFSDGAQVDACADHQWVTWTAADRKAFLRSPYEDTSRMPANWPVWRLRRVVATILPRERVETALALYADGLSIRQVVARTGLSRNGLTRHLKAARYLPSQPKMYPDSPGPRIRTTQDVVDTLTAGKRGDTNHAIPVCGPLDLPEASLPVDPYVLGVWLGDGTGREGVVTIGDEDAGEMLGHLAAAGAPLSGRPQRRAGAKSAAYPVGGAPPVRNPRTGRMTANGSLHSALEALGVRGNKHVPAAYLRASAGQRLALLQGLMDTDGGWSGANVEYTSTLRVLAEATAELARSLGQKAVVREGRATLNGRDCGPKWRVRWTPTVNCFRLQRKAALFRVAGPQMFRRHHRMIVGAEPIVPRPMRCITVDSPNHMYLCGESMIPTHNSWTGAHTLAEWILGDPEPGEWGIVAPIYSDAWSVCVEGESGFLAALGTNAEEVKRGKSKLVEYWHRSFAEIKLRSGHIVRVASAEDGGLRIQGKNLKGAWCDEVGLWDSWKTTWDESLKFAVRKGRSQIVATGTPKKSRKARELIRRLLADPAVRKSRLRTLDNRNNLSQEFLDEVVSSSRGTRLEQQELEGVLLDDVEGALWTADGIDAFRVAAEPELLRVVVAVDPAVSNEEDSDETGIVVVGEGAGGHGFVLADYSMRGTPDACMRKAVWAYHHHAADKVIGEANNGGDYIGALLATVDPDVPYEKVMASRGKRVRAEPVSALYEQGRVHHVGDPRKFTMLEEQMVSWVPSDPGESPDRVDALVWGCAALKGLSSGSWLQAYGMKRCDDCGAAYAERHGACPACHPPAPGAPAPPDLEPAEPQALTGWATAYGDFVRCPGCQRPYDTRRHKGCPHCGGGAGLAQLAQNGKPGGFAGLGGMFRGMNLGGFR